jgi:hypothetical protein
VARANTLRGGRGSYNLCNRGEGSKEDVERRSVQREEQSMWGSNLLRMFKVDRPGRRGRTYNLPCAPENQGTLRNTLPWALGRFSRHPAPP